MERKISFVYFSKFKISFSLLFCCLSDLTSFSSSLTRLDVGVRPAPVSWAAARRDSTSVDKSAASCRLVAVSMAHCSLSRFISSLIRLNSSWPSCSNCVRYLKPINTFRHKSISIYQEGRFCLAEPLLQRGALTAEPIRLRLQSVALFPRELQFSFDRLKPI